MVFQTDPDTMGGENFEDYRRVIDDPATVHAMLAVYRPGLGIDRATDGADMRNARMVSCPTLVLWASRDDLELLYGDLLDVWRHWAVDLRGRPIDSGHHMAEEVPEELAREIANFLTKI